MSTIVTRAGKGSALTHTEMDANFNNLNNDKYQSGNTLTVPITGNDWSGNGSISSTDYLRMIVGQFNTGTGKVNAIQSASGAAARIFVGNSDPFSSRGYLIIAGDDTTSIYSKNFAVFANSGHTFGCNGTFSFKYAAGGSTGPQDRFVIATSGDVEASGNVTAYSDKRLKDNIEQIKDPINKVKQIRGVTFTRNDSLPENKDIRHAGVIAQEVQKVLPEVIKSNKEGMLTVAYGNMVGLLIEAIKDQQTQIDKLQEKVDALHK